jgi:transposase-like protein
MLYRFQSRATPPFVMLEVNARQLFEIIGRSPAPKGVITTDQMPAAIAALEAAMAREGENAHNADAYAVEGHDNEAEKQHIGLRQRAAPLLHMLKDSLADGKDVIWEV